MSALKIIGLAIAIWFFWLWLRGPDGELLADIVAADAVRSALKPANVAFGPLVQKSAPDGARIVGGVATVRGRELAFQVRVEAICQAAERSCYRPHILILAKP